MARNKKYNSSSSGGECTSALADNKINEARKEREEDNNAISQ